MTRRTITLERTYQAPIEDVWELWTTKDGLESWWGPDGFAVTVHALDLRPGGELRYEMAAVGAEQRAFIQSAGMPLSTVHAVRYTEVVPPRRLAYVHPMDFVPGVPAYEVAHLVELYAEAGGVRMVLTFDAMHDEQQTRYAVMGWENELDKLGRRLARTPADAPPPG